MSGGWGLGVEHGSITYDRAPGVRIMGNVTDGRHLDDRHSHSGHAQRPGASAGRALTLATISFALSFAAWGLVGGLASTFAGLYTLTASQTALLAYSGSIDRCLLTD